MLHPDTEVRWISAEIGCGVLATREIPKGTIIWAMDPLDRTLSPERVELLPPVCRDSLLKYSYRNRDGDYFYCWDNTRFMNHSFYPNSIATAYGYELAVRDIRAGRIRGLHSLRLVLPPTASDSRLWNSSRCWADRKKSFMSQPPASGSRQLREGHQPKEKLCPQPGRCRERHGWRRFSRVLRTRA